MNIQKKVRIIHHIIVMLILISQNYKIIQYASKHSQNKVRKSQSFPSLQEAPASDHKEETVTCTLSFREDSFKYI